MDSITVSVRFVDGGLQEFQVDSGFLQKFQSLKAQGLEGRELIHQMLTDDWGAPPMVVSIFGVTPDGQHIDIHIPYI